MTATTMAGKAGTITLRTREREHDIEVHVEDNGGGVVPDLEERIFDLFFSTKEHGTGLGLSIARRIASLGLKSPPRCMIVTAHGREEVISNARAAGIEDVLLKPLELAVVGLAVDKALRQGLAMLLKMREREGAYLRKDLCKRMAAMRKAKV